MKYFRNIRKKDLINFKFKILNCDCKHKRYHRVKSRKDTAYTFDISPTFSLWILLSLDCFVKLQHPTLPWDPDSPDIQTQTPHRLEHYHDPRSPPCRRISTCERIGQPRDNLSGNHDKEKNLTWPLTPYHFVARTAIALDCAQITSVGQRQLSGVRTSKGDVVLAEWFSHLLSRKRGKHGTMPWSL